VYRPGDVKAIMGEGMPVYRDPFTFGNLYIELQVVFPEKIPQEALKILARFFPVPSRIPTPSDAQEVIHLILFPLLPDHHHHVHVISG